MSRPDPAINYLRRQGYTALRTPSVSLKPLHLLLKTRRRELSRLGAGSLAALFESDPDLSLPAVQRSRGGPSISGLRSGSVDISIGLNLLSGFMGSKVAGLAAGYGRARTVVFEFADVAEHAADLVELDAYLARASLRQDLGPTMLHELIDNDVYVVCSALRSRRLAMEARDEAGRRLAVDLPLIQNLLQAAPGGSAATGNADRVVYDRGRAITFGIQAARLFFANAGPRQPARFRKFRLVKADRTTVRGPQTLAPTQPGAIEWLRPVGMFQRLEGVP